MKEICITSTFNDFQPAFKIDGHLTCIKKMCKILYRRHFIADASIFFQNPSLNFCSIRLINPSIQ